MAKVPRFTSSAFSLRETPVQQAEGINFDGLQRIANTLIERGAKDNTEAAFEEGVAAQQELGGKSLTQREKGFFGGDIDDAFNKGARMAFGIHKERAIKQRVFDLFKENEFDEEAFKTSFNDEAFQEKLMEHVDIKDLVAFQKVANSNFDTQINEIRRCFRATPDNMSS